MKFIGILSFARRRLTAGAKFLSAIVQKHSSGEEKSFVCNLNWKRMAKKCNENRNGMERQFIVERSYQFIALNFGTSFKC